jgi:predicted Rossmann fold flavoprotein
MRRPGCLQCAVRPIAMPEWDVIVIGAGAAGLLAAARAAERGRRTLLLEKNRKPGVKILMSGGTRCNLTHATDARGIVDAFGCQGPFLHSSLAALGPQSLVDLFAAEGVATKTEQTGKIFPASNKAADVLQALLRRLTRSGATLSLGETVCGISRAEAGLQVLTASRTLTAAKVILTTGGQSYPGCGTTGDGYAWARNMGHSIVPLRPALVPVASNAAWVSALKGITVADVAVRVTELAPHSIASGDSTRKAIKGRQKAARIGTRGSFLFTHFGVSGPVILDVSREITGHPNPETLALECDFAPTLGDTDFDDELRRQGQSAGRKAIATLLPVDLPQRLVDTLLAQATVPLELRGAELSAAHRARVVRTFKHCLIPISGTLGFPKAEVTAGGVSLAEVDSRTMQSRIVPGLYPAGEILDLDGPIGGYNFQAAFSTGWLAAQNV